MCGESTAEGGRGCSFFCSRGVVTKGTRSSSSGHRRTQFKTPHQMLINEEREWAYKNVVEIEPPKVIEQIPELVTDEEKVTENGASDVHVDRLTCADSDRRNDAEHRFPMIIRKSLSSNRNEGLLLKEERSSTTSLNEIELELSSGSKNRLESKNLEEPKSVSVRLGESLDGCEVRPTESINECQLSSPRKNSLKEAKKDLSQERSCGNLSTSSEPGVSNQPTKQLLTPLDEIKSDELRSTSKLSHSEGKPHSVLSIASVSPSEVFDIHECLSLEDIFSTEIENEIPMTHDYLRPSAISTRRSPLKLRSL